MPMKLVYTRQIIPTLNNFPPPTPSSPAAPPSSTAKVLKLDSIKDVETYLDALGIIGFYLWDPDFSPGLADGALVTTSSNFEAGRLWEGQLCLAVKDSKLQFLFENTGNIYNGRGFKMLATLNAYCCLDSVANTFSSLLLIINKLQGENELILAFCSCYDGLILEMACCKAVIPPLLLLMLSCGCCTVATPTSWSNSGHGSSLLKQRQLR
jgi:hypothetical protein